MKKDVRTRIAPSPTGEFHIGGMRTLLYDWAFARKYGGKIVIRLEDTDQARLVEGSAERILKVISDYGLDWDEGPDKAGEYGPYVQSERLDIYKKHVEELANKGSAYACFCTNERLATMREEQKKQGLPVTKYDRKCFSLEKEEVDERIRSGESHVIRLKMPDDRVVKFSDGVCGEVSFNTKELDDQVLMKSDGFPTYHLAVVVDDHLMKISHVMRGIDWLPSTPKQVILYEAFGWDAPEFIHLPNLKELGENKKMSKRHGPVSAREFLDQGYLPEAILNFLMLLGWNSGSEKEIYSLNEFIQEFSVERIHKTDLVAFDREKLSWFNSQYIQKMENRELAERIFEFYKGELDKDIIVKTAELVKTRIKKLSDYKEMCRFLFERPDLSSIDLNEEEKKYLEKAVSVMEKVEKWELDDLNEALMKVIGENEYKVGKFFMAVRSAVSGQKVTPPINESMIILGKDEVIRRISNQIKA